MKIIANSAHQTSAEGQNIVQLPNDADPLTLDLAGVTRIDLHFPKFSDGRAFSQARLLRERYGFTGELRATGNVLRDQLLMMARAGFDAFELEKAADAGTVHRALTSYSIFYQPTGDGRRTAAETRRAAKGRLA